MLLGNNVEVIHGPETFANKNGIVRMDRGFGMRVFPGGNQVDGLPPAPSFQNSYIGFYNTFRTFFLVYLLALPTVSLQTNGWMLRTSSAMDSWAPVLLQAQQC